MQPSILFPEMQLFYTGGNIHFSLEYFSTLPVWKVETIHAALGASTEPDK
jgi:hypothetical protein